MKSSLRIKAKKKRALINLKSESENTFLNHINSCLDTVFSIDNNIKVIGLYYPILDEISPFGFIKYLKTNNITTSLPVVQKTTKAIVFKKWDQKRRQMMEKICQSISFGRTTRKTWLISIRQCAKVLRSLMRDTWKMASPFRNFTSGNKSVGKEFKPWCKLLKL